MTRNACLHAKSLSYVQLCETVWTVAHQAPLSMGFSRQEYWSELPWPPPGDLPEPGIELRSLVSSLAGGFFTISATWKPNDMEWDLPKTDSCVCVDVSTHLPIQGFGKFNVKSLPPRLGAWWEGALESYHRNTIFLCPLSEALPQKIREARPKAFECLSQCTNQRAPRKD